MRVSVNISSRQFRCGTLASVVRAALRESGLDARLRELALTESLLVENTEEAIQILAELKAIGVSIVIDDFGWPRGVEERAQLDFLGTQGGDEVQGFLFSRPVAANSIVSAVASAGTALAPALSLRSLQRSA